jgi:hypothetical protein
MGKGWNVKRDMPVFLWRIDTTKTIIDQPLSYPLRD